MGVVDAFPAELPPVTVAAQNAPADGAGGKNVKIVFGMSSSAASLPNSRPAGRDVPVYTRDEMAAVLKVAERDKGAIAEQRDQALEKAKLGDEYAKRLQAELAAAQQRAAWLPWVIGGAALLGGVIVGMVVGAVVEARKHEPDTGTKNAPLELQGAWQRATGW